MKKTEDLFQPKDARTVRFDKKTKLWIPNRKRLFLYWYKFLQHALRDDNREVNMRKYRGWGSRETILTEKFDSWWSDRWIKLFGYPDDGKPKYSLSTNRPKTDAIRYALLVYENRHRGSNFEIGFWLETRELANRYSVGTIELVFQVQKILAGQKYKRSLKKEDPRRTIIDHESRNWTTSRVVVGGHEKQVRDEDIDLYLERLNKYQIQSVIGRYKRNAEKILNNVCDGVFP